MNATQNCARRWSIRPQPPRCSPSSVARPQTCSRSSTLSSKAPPRFVGLTTWFSDYERRTVWLRGLILVPYPLTALRSVLMSHSINGCASMARSTFPTVAEILAKDERFDRAGDEELIGCRVGCHLVTADIDAEEAGRVQKSVSSREEARKCAK